MSKLIKKKDVAAVATPKTVAAPAPVKETVKKSVTKIDNKQPKGERETIVKDESVSVGMTLATIEPTRRVGMSKAMTVNMGNYESAKIGVWIERVVPDNDREEATAMTEISGRLDEYLKVEVSELQK